ncbi:MAG: LapA family protein [Firmicutes bacterium]|nr:LapA family protein [Bacillota bacterium]
MLVHLAVVLMIALFVSVFAFQNAMPVNIFFLLWNITGVPLFIIVIGAFVTGAFFTFFLGLAREIKSALRLRELNQENRLLKLEIDRLNSGLKQPGGANKSQN